jgi:hypothetical protein
MESSRNDLLLATLGALRPAPAPGFAAELDERVAAGFPPRAHPASAPFARLATWLRSLAPRRIVFAGGGVALACVAIATVIVAGTNGGGSGADRGGVEAGAPGGSTLGQLNLFSQEGKPAPAQTEASPSSSSAGSGSSGAAEEASSAVGSSGIEFEAEVPSQADSATKASGQGASSGTGPYASQANHRHVERAAEITLGAEPGEVGEAAGRVLEAVHQYDGIVLRSSVQGGSEGEAGADFELLIPSAKLSDALAAFSAVAEVRSRHEASDDITAPTNTVGEQLQDSHARIDGLLNELADSETESEREAVEAQLRSERRNAAALKAQLSNLQRRANLSHVSLRIVSDESRAPGAGGPWDAGDAFHDAGQILAVAAGVAIVGLAVLAPIALLALLVWLANRTWIRQRRERALG